MGAATDFIECGDICVNGGWQASHARESIEVVSAATEEKLGRVPDASRADMDAAVDAARKAFDEGPFPRWSPA